MRIKLLTFLRHKLGVVLLLLAYFAVNPVAKGDVLHADLGSGWQDYNFNQAYTITSTGDKEFGVKNGNTWYSCGQCSKITRTDTSAKNYTNGGGNNKINIDVPGSYKFYIDYNDNRKVTVDYPWVVYGNFNGSWQSFALSGSGTELTATVNITSVGDYNFKVVTDKWYGCANTYQRSDGTSGTYWNFSDTENNATMHADVTGNYTFTWHKNDHKVKITYPTCPTPTVSITDGPTSVCPGATSLQYTASGSSTSGTTISSYSWSVTANKGWSGGSGTDNTATFTAGTANATISVNVTNSCGTSSSTAGTRDVTVKTKPSLSSVTGPDELTASTNPAGTYSTNNISGATYHWESNITGIKLSNGNALNTATGSSIEVKTGSTTESSKYIRVYATKDGCDGSKVSQTVSVIPACSSASVTAVTPSSAQTKSLPTSSATPSVTQAVTATYSGGNQKGWTVTPSTISGYTAATFDNAASESTYLNMKYEGEYTATFGAGCGNTTDATLTTAKITVNPSEIYIAGPLLKGGNDWATNTLMTKGSNSFYYDWDAARTTGEFTLRTSNSASEAAYIIPNYAKNNYTGISPAEDGNHNLSVDGVSFAVGDKVRVTAKYKGWNSSEGKPEYDITFTKRCSYPTAGSLTAPSSVCSGTNFTLTLSEYTSSGTTIQWQKSTNGGSTWSNVTNGTPTGTTGATTASLTTSQTVATQYRAVVTTTTGGCSSETNGYSVAITPDASIGSVTLSSSTICMGQTGTQATANTVVTGGGVGAWSSTNEAVATVNSSGVITTVGAGTTNIRYTITGGCGGEVYKQTPLKVKAIATAAQYTLSNNTKTYNGSSQAATVTPASGAGAATVYYTGTGSTTYAESTTAPTNAGTYAVTVDAANGDDYCAATNLSVGTLTINKADQSPLTISNTLLDFAYCTGSHTTLTTSGGSGDGAVTYTITSGSGTVDGSTLTATANGSISVTATKAESANYNATTSAAKTFNFTHATPTPYAISAASTAICSGGGGTITLAGSQTEYNYLLYNGITPLDDEGEIKPGTGSAITFDVSSSGVYTAKGYYGTNRENCLTDMEETVVMTISTTPKLVRSATTVTNYTPVTITSVNTDIETWSITNESDTAYSYDKTANSITFKGLSNKSPYTVTATTHGGCSNTTTITVNADTEVCP